METTTMRAHKYAVGSFVEFKPGPYMGEAKPGSYTVVRHLPSEGAGNQYRIKSSRDGHERIANESQLG
jgi:hypothetical protein